MVGVRPWLDFRFVPDISHADSRGDPRGPYESPTRRDLSVLLPSFLEVRRSISAIPSGPTDPNSGNYACPGFSLLVHD